MQQELAPFGIKVQIVEVFLGDLPQRREFAQAGISEQNVEAAIDARRSPRQNSSSSAPPAPSHAPSRFIVTRS
jgi:hypothetical protein